MKKLVAVMMFALCGSYTYAYTNISDCATALEYWARSNATARIGTDYAICAEADGYKIRWKVDGIAKPTIEQLDSIIPQALAWKSNQVAEAAADIDKLEVKYVLRALVKTINKRLPADKQVKEVELKAAIKAEVWQ